MQTEERITTELVREFVMAAHGDLEIGFAGSFVKGYTFPLKNESK
ncbi:hypothetical protein bcgnr5369_68540 [Bacillus cereus]